MLNGTPAFKGRKRLSLNVRACSAAVCPFVQPTACRIPLTQHAWLVLVAKLFCACKGDGQKLFVAWKS